MKPKHGWNDEENVVGLYLYLYETDGLGLSEEQILGRLAAKYPSRVPITLGSMKMKKQNYRHLDIEAGITTPSSYTPLSHPSKPSRRIYADYRDASQADLRRHVLEII